MGNSSVGRASIICISAFMTLTACISPQQRVATAVIDARRSNNALPLPHLIDETLTIATAYRIQTRVVKQQLHGAQPAGYKAGLTSPQPHRRAFTHRNQSPACCRATAASHRADAAPERAARS